MKQQLGTEEISLTSNQPLLSGIKAEQTKKLQGAVSPRFG